jgi:hypothetical protein
MEITHGVLAPSVASNLDCIRWRFASLTNAEKFARQFGGVLHTAYL